MGILGGVGSIIGGIAGRGAVKAGNRAYNEALEKLKKAYGEQTILNPEDYVADYEMMDPEQLEYYAPLLEQAEQMGDTNMANISLDPAVKEQQMQALAKLAERADQGLSLSDLAARNQIMSSAAQQNRGNQDAVMQSMARRGTLGSGQELAARMAGAQNAYANSAGELEALAAARDNNALQAALQSGNLAGNMRSQEYGEQSDMAKARDAIAQFNTNQRANVGTRNIGNQNLAAQSAAQLRNQTYGSNLDLKNQQKEQRVQGLQSATNAQNQKGLDIAGVGVNQGQARQQQGMQTGAYRAGMGKAAGGLADQAVKAIATMGMSEAVPNKDSTFEWAGADQKEQDSGGGGFGGMFSGLTKMIS